METFIRRPDGRRYTGPEFVAEIRARAACPECSAAAGDYCTYPGGARRQANHRARVEAVTGQTQQEMNARMGARSRKPGQKTRRRRQLGSWTS